MRKRFLSRHQLATQTIDDEVDKDDATSVKSNEGKSTWKQVRCCLSNKYSMSNSSPPKCGDLFYANINNPEAMQKQTIHLTRDFIH